MERPEGTTTPRFLIRVDWLLIWGRRHLEAVLDEYVRHYTMSDRIEAWIFGRQR